MGREPLFVCRALSTGAWRRDLNLDFIEPSTKDTDGSFRDEGKKTFTSQWIYAVLRTRGLRPVLVEALPLLFIVALPLSVHAGLLSSMLGFFGETTIAYEKPQTTSVAGSDARLLSARANPDPSEGQGGGDIIIDEDALVSGGPFGLDVQGSQYQNGEISIYVVKEGDTLSQIAEMFDVTSNTILWANDLKSKTDIHPGDSLVILPIVGVRHIVKSGDTIGSIAKKYGGDAEEILSYNQLASASDLSVGATLIIPNGNLHESAPKPASGGHSSGIASVSSGGGFQNPLPGSVRTQGLHGYNGVDLAGLPAGTSVRAAAGGEVIVARSSGWNGGYGNYVVIKHGNGTQTLYAHLNYVNVANGASVGAGDVVGGVGSTGRSTGTHLHFEVRGASNPF